MALVETTSNNERRAAALRAQIKTYRVGTVQAPERRPADGKRAAPITTNPKVHVRRFVAQSPLRRRRLVEQRRAGRRPRFMRRELEQSTGYARREDSSSPTRTIRISTVLT